MEGFGAIAFLVLFVFLLIGLVLTFVGIYNSLIALKEEITKAWANIDVILKQRYDELPKLIEVCNQFIKHEVAIIDRIMKAREKMVSGNREEQIEGANAVTAGLSGLLAVGEAYPEIKSNSNFMQIQTRISDLEESLADRREYYNNSTTNYNVRIQQIPYNILAGFLNYNKEPLFEVQDHEKAYPDLKIKTLES